MNVYSDQSGPLVSVLMTAYNREKYIAEAIDSVLASTYTHFELIIVDDGSSDSTVKIAREYEKKDPRIKVYVNESNLGQFYNRNKAASYAKGKYLKYLDSDDKIFDFGLEYCVTQMEKYPDAAIGMIVYYDMGPGDSFCLSPEKIVHDHFFDRQYLVIGPSGTIIRTESFHAINGFDPRFGVASDTYFNILLAASAPVVLLPKDFFSYRLHAGQEQNNPEGYIKFNYLYFKALMEQVRLPLKKGEVAYLLRKLKKRHAIVLTKYVWNTKDLKRTRQLLHDTGFKWTDVLTGYFK